MPSIPDWLSWTDIAFSIAAFILAVMAAPTILQMFWGRACLRFEFDRYVQEDERRLLVYLQNPRITNRVLRGVGVRRDGIQSLTVMSGIAEAGSGTIVDPIRHSRISSDSDLDDKGLSRIALPPTLSVAASVEFVQWDVQEGVASLPPDRLRKRKVLQPGRYRMDIVFSVDGEPQKVSRDFVVGLKSDDLIWVPS